YIKICATRYFEYLVLRKHPFSSLERQIYTNSFLARLDALHRDRTSLESRCRLVNDILDGTEERFRYLHPTLIDTRSNLNTDVIKDICIVCGIESTYFETNRILIDVIMLKRRNAIAHGQQEYIREDEIDDLVANVLSLMTTFRN